MTIKNISRPSNVNPSDRDAYSVYKDLDSLVSFLNNTLIAKIDELEGRIADLEINVENLSSSR
jgi:hypothetical protein